MEQIKNPLPVEISVGLSGDYPVLTEVKPKGGAHKFSLIRARGIWLAIWFAITAIIFIGLYFLAKKSNILRDRAPVLWGQEKPFSLSAFQAAWWFVIVFLSFIFIWLVTGQYDFSTTALILLSIGLGTTVGANLIDATKRNTNATTADNNDNLKLLLSDKEKIEEDMTRLANAASKEEAAIIAKKTEYDDVILKIKTKFPNSIGPAHKSFILDILTDINGVSFHRFQMFVWTIVLGFFFIISALGRLAMPQFSETLLALMGVSAGTFLAFKFPENNTAPTQPATPTGGVGGGGGDGVVGEAAAEINIGSSAATLNPAGETAGNVEESAIANVVETALPESAQIDQTGLAEAETIANVTPAKPKRKKT